MRALFLQTQKRSLFNDIHHMRILVFLSIVILLGCSHFSQPELRKYSVRMWSDDNTFDGNFSQIMTLVEKDQLIYLVNNLHFDTLHIDGKKVFGTLHSVYVNQAHLYQFDGLIVNKTGKEFLIKGTLKDNQTGYSLNYEIY